jgi:hypothetical protein
MSLVKSLIVVVFIIVTTLSSVRADFLTGRDLNLYCTSGSPQDDAICIVYITGAVDAFTTAELIAEKTAGMQPGLCIPEGIQPDNFKEIIINWMKRPETNPDFAATLIILAAVDDAFGCAKN